MNTAVSHPPQSFTSVSVFRECPLAYHLRYVLRVPAGRPAHLVAGEVAHRAIAKYVKRLRDSGRPADIGALEKIAEEVTFDLPSDVAGSVIHALNKFGEVFILDVPRGGEVLIEEQLGLTDDLDLCDWSDRRAAWRGVIDLAVLDRNGHAKITDFKTGYSMLHDEIQPWTYFLLLNRAKGVTSATAEFLFIRHARVAGPFHLDADDIEAAERWVRANIKKVREEERFKATPGPHCSNCGYAGSDHCPADLSGVGVIRTREEAETVAAEIERLDGAAKRRKSALAVWSAAHGPVRIGVEGKEVEYAHRPTESVSPDIKALCSMASEDGSLDDLYPLLSLKRSRAATNFVGAYRKRLEEEGKIRVTSSTRFSRKRVAGEDENGEDNDSE